MAVTLIEEKKKRYRYRGYIIRERESTDGETYYDIIKPKWDSTYPIWDWCASIDEAKLWINSDIADSVGKEEECLDEVMGPKDGKYVYEVTYKIIYRDDKVEEKREEVIANTTAEAINAVRNSYRGELVRDVRTKKLGPRTENNPDYMIPDEEDEYFSEDPELERKVDEHMAVKLIKEDSEPKTTPKWTVKQFSFDAAIKGDDSSRLGLNGSTGGKFFKDLCKFLEDHGMEMAGDFISAEDMTSVYTDNEYEFFTEDLKESAENLSTPDAIAKAIDPASTFMHDEDGFYNYDSSISHDDFVSRMTELGFEFTNTPTEESYSNGEFFVEYYDGSQYDSDDTDTGFMIYKA